MAIFTHQILIYEKTKKEIFFNHYKKDLLVSNIYGFGHMAIKGAV